MNKTFLFVVTLMLTLLSCKETKTIDTKNKEPKKDSLSTQNVRLVEKPSAKKTSKEKIIIKKLPCIDTIKFKELGYSWKRKPKRYDADTEQRWSVIHEVDSCFTNQVKGIKVYTEKKCDYNEYLVDSIVLKLRNNKTQYIFGNEFFNDIIPIPSFWFKDINFDGIKDIMIFDKSSVGTKNSGHTTYLYNKRTQRFNSSKYYTHLCLDTISKTVSSWGEWGEASGLHVRNIYKPDTDSLKLIKQFMQEYFKKEENKWVISKNRKEGKFMRRVTTYLNDGTKEIKMDTLLWEHMEGYWKNCH